MASRASIALLCLVLTLLASCQDKGVEPREPVITMSQDNFQFQGTGMLKYTKTLSYDWKNSGAVANINQACEIDSGSATLTILDADSVEVYSKNLTENGTFVTSSGTPGTWLIRVTLTDVFGTLSFRAQKKT